MMNPFRAAKNFFAKKGAGGASSSPMSIKVRNVESRSGYDATEFELDERTNKAKLLGQSYFLQGPAGMEFDESLVRELRISYPGAVPIHRVMSFVRATGGEIHCHNFGIACYSQRAADAANNPAHPHHEPVWRQKLFSQALVSRPKTGYLSTLEIPNMLDAFFPLIGMNDQSLPAAYEPFDRKMLDTMVERIAARNQYKDHDALAAFADLEQRKAEEREKRTQLIYDEARHDFIDRLSVGITPSTSKVRATPLHLHIKG